MSLMIVFIFYIALGRLFNKDYMSFLNVLYEALDTSSKARVTSDLS